MEWVKRPLLLPGSKPLATEDWIPKSQFLIANMTPTRTHASAAYVGYGLTQSCPFHGYGQFGDASNNGRWIEYDMAIPGLMQTYGSVWSIGEDLTWVFWTLRS